jgi:hypothetical protein
MGGMDLGEICEGGWRGFTWFWIGTGGGCCDHGDESSGSGTTELVNIMCIIYHLIQKKQSNRSALHYMLDATWYIPHYTEWIKDSLVIYCRLNQPHTSQHW